MSRPLDELIDEQVKKFGSMYGHDLVEADDIAIITRVCEDIISRTINSFQALIVAFTIEQYVDEFAADCLEQLEGKGPAELMQFFDELLKNER